MALQVFNTDTVSTGVIANLGTDDDLYVKAGVLLASTDASVVVSASGSGQTLHIDGQVVSDTTFAISVDGGNHLYLGESSLVRSFNSDAINLAGSDTSIEMNGRVFADNYGLLLSGSGAAESDVTNTGTIFGRDTGCLFVTSDFVTLDNSGVISGSAGVWTQGSGNVSITNSGTIKGSSTGITNLGTGTLSIENAGLIRLGIYLGSESDSYDGRLGRVIGTVEAGAGNDTIKGGTSNERFQGDTGRDILSGGAGADMFIYLAAADSTNAIAGRDLIGDFSHRSHDILDVSSIDARPATGGDDDFSFVGTSAFSSTSGQIRYAIQGNSTFVYFNTDTDKAAEMTIELTGKIHLVASDFAL